MREAGYYWVKRQGRKWEVAEYVAIADVWSCCGDALDGIDADFERIGPPHHAASGGPAPMTTAPKPLLTRARAGHLARGVEGR